MVFSIILIILKPMGSVHIRMTNLALGKKRVFPEHTSAISIVQGIYCVNCLLYPNLWGVL